MINDFNHMSTIVDETTMDIMQVVIEQAELPFTIETKGKDLTTVHEELKEEGYHILSDVIRVSEGNLRIYLGIIRDDIEELIVLTKSDLMFGDEGINMEINVLHDEVLTEFNLDYKQSKLGR